MPLAAPPPATLVDVLPEPVVDAEVDADAVVEPELLLLLVVDEEEEESSVTFHSRK